MKIQAKPIILHFLGVKTTYQGNLYMEIEIEHFGKKSKQKIFPGDSIDLNKSYVIDAD